MTLGEKLKAARLEAGLSQRQLCGDRLTRNMLSLLEHGSAKPSMDTLQYLAARLGRPMRYFLDDGDADSPAQAANALAAGEYPRALELLADIGEPEYAPLKAEALLGAAEMAIAAGKRPYARKLLAQLDEHPLRAAAVEDRKNLLLNRAGASAPLPEIDEILLLKAERAAQSGDYTRCAALLEAVESRDEAWYLLRGKALFAAGRYAEARTALERAPAQTCAALLEKCCLELEDYKGAYYYACLQKK